MLILTAYIDNQKCTSKQFYIYFAYQRNQFINTHILITIIIVVDHMFKLNKI